MISIETYLADKLRLLGVKTGTTHLPPLKPEIPLWDRFGRGWRISAHAARRCILR